MATKKMSIKFTNTTTSLQQQQQQSPPDTPTTTTTTFDDFTINSLEDYQSVQLSINDNTIEDEEESEDNNSESISDLLQQSTINKQAPKVEDEIDLIDAKEMNNRMEKKNKSSTSNKMDKFMKHLQEAFTSNNSDKIESDNITTTTTPTPTQNQNSTSWLNDIKFNLNKLRNDSNKQQQQQQMKLSESIDNFNIDNQNHQQLKETRKLSIATGVKNNNYPLSLDKNVDVNEQMVSLNEHLINNESSDHDDNKQHCNRPQKLKLTTNDQSVVKKKFTLFENMKTFQMKNKQQQQQQQDLFNKLISPIRTTTPSPTATIPSSSLLTSALLSPNQHQHNSSTPSSSSISSILSAAAAKLSNEKSSSNINNSKSSSIENIDSIVVNNNCNNIRTNNNKSNKMTNSKSMMTFLKVAGKNDDNTTTTTITNIDEEELNELELLSTCLSSNQHHHTQNPTLRKRIKCSPSRNRTPTPDESINLIDQQQQQQESLKTSKHRLSNITHTSSSTSSSSSASTTSLSSTSLPLLNEKSSSLLLNEKKFDTTLVNDNLKQHHQQQQQIKQRKIDHNKQSLWTTITSSFTFHYYIIIFMSILSGFFLCISPLPSFLNGFIFGFLCTFFIFTMGIVYLVANFFLIKSDDRTEQSSRLTEQVGLKRTRSKRLSFNVSSTSNNNNDCIIYAGWVYEFIGDYIEREKNGFVSRLVYLVLSGSKLNIFVPSQEMNEKKLTKILSETTTTTSSINQTSTTSNKNLSLQSQKVIDFSRLHYKRICLYLTKNVRNQRKYIWSKKYPICIEFNNEDTTRGQDDVESQAPTPIISKLVIFARTCREKEEWFWSIKTSIDQSINNQKSSIRGSNNSLNNSNNNTNDSPSESKTYLFVTSTGELKQTITDSESHQQQQQQQPHNQQQFLHILTRRLTYQNFMRTNILNSEGLGPGNPGMMTPLTWFNVLLNRLSFDILNKPNWSAYIAKKLQRKLRRLRLPYFMESLTITEIDIGTTLPKFNSVPSVPNVDDAGLWIEFDVNYSGGFTMTLETKINLLKLSANVENLNDVSPASTPNDSPKLTQKNTGKYWKGYRARYRTNTTTTGGIQSPTPGTELNNDEYCDDDCDSDIDSIVTSSEDEEPETAPAAPDDADTDEKQKKLIRFVEKIAFNQYFQKASQMNFVKKALEGVSNMSIMLTVQINSLNGTLAINIPEPPTDRLWYGFRNDPTISITARPKLGDHDLNLGYVTNFIEKKLRTEFFNYFVIPNMDDFFIPALNTSIEQYINVVP